MPKLEFLGGIRVEGKEHLWLETKGGSDLSGFVLWKILIISQVDF